MQPNEKLLDPQHSFADPEFDQERLKNHILCEAVCNTNEGPSCRNKDTGGCGAYSEFRAPAFCRNHEAVQA